MYEPFCHPKTLHNNGLHGVQAGGLGFSLRLTCNPNNLQFCGFYLLIKRYLLLICRLLEPQVELRVWGL